MEVIRIRMFYTLYNLSDDYACETAGYLLNLFERVNFKSNGSQRLCYGLRSEVTLKIVLEPIVRNLHIFLLLNYIIL